MDGQLCSFCKNCTPVEGHPELGECTVIGAVVVHAQTGGRCRMFRLPGVKTVRVRVAVCTSDDGTWGASGSGCSVTTDDEQQSLAADQADYNDANVMAEHWLEADLPLPQSVTVEGEVGS